MYLRSFFLSAEPVALSARCCWSMLFRNKGGPHGLFGLSGEWKYLTLLENRNAISQIQVHSKIAIPIIAEII
jgi:hypothetical protein